MPCWFGNDEFIMVRDNLLRIASAIGLYVAPAYADVLFLTISSSRCFLKKMGILGLSVLKYGILCIVFIRYKS